MEDTEIKIFVNIESQENTPSPKNYWKYTNENKIWSLENSENTMKIS